MITQSGYIFFAHSSYNTPIYIYIYIYRERERERGDHFSKRKFLKRKKQYRQNNWTRIIIKQHITQIANMEPEKIETKIH